MNCNLVRRYLHDFIDQKLPDERSSTIESHLASCVNCSNEKASTDKLIHELKNIPVPTLSSQQWNTLHHSILRELPNTSKNSFSVYAVQPQSLKNFFTPLRSLAALVVISLVSAAIIYPRYMSPLSRATAEYPNINSVSGNAFSVDAQNNMLPLGNQLSMLPGSAVQTDSISTAKIQIDAKSTIDLGKNTRFGVQEYSTDKTILSLQQGNLLAQVSKRSSHQLFRIETPNAFCEVIGTEFKVTTLEDSFHKQHLTMLVVTEGRVKFGSQDKTTFVDAGNAVLLYGDSLTEQLPSSHQMVTFIAEKPGLGSIFIETKPAGADVIINGSIVGKTPYSGTAPYGEHIIALNKKGFTPWTGTLSIDPLTSAKTSITLLAKEKKTSTKSTPEPLPVIPATNNGTIASGEIIDHSVLRHAVSLINNGYYHDARAVLDGLIYDPKTPTSIKVIAYQKLSTCYKNMGEYDDAIKALTIIINGNYGSDNRSLALFERATIYKNNLQNVAAAIDDLKSYLSTYKNGIWLEEATITLADLYAFKQMYAKSADMFALFTAKYKNHARYEYSLFTLGATYYNFLNDYTAARSTFGKLLQEFPGSRYTEDALFLSAECLMKQGNPSRAITAYNNYLNRFPSGKWASEVKTYLYRIETSEAH